MQIDLTPEQYRHLVTLMFLGEWVINGLPPERRPQQLQEVADYIYTLAEEFGASDWIGYCEDCGAWHPNQSMEETLLPIVDEYDEETFWDVLAHHLAYRDVMLGADPDAELTPALEMRLWRRKEQYQQEFDKHGLDHVRLVFPGKKSGRSGKSTRE
ncbi:MAG: hypothetical protein K6T63_01110 [Alicyclobacillus herbarius]|uniref:hypothetical protein n=1 Tax=Alicyclobacillus herbarius TaxID=122960 RepID=UPI0023540402|nr:hypothetical protein [Alicyclobacillus herbarius]MCL6631205.1 hypothetical protein [Alicyclobacillus herbarius]